MTGGEGEITRRYAPRPLRGRPSGVIFASWLPPPADPVGREFAQRLAERVRFELTRAVRPCRFSRPVHSTALPPLRSPIAIEINCQLYIALLPRTCAHWREVCTQAGEISDGSSTTHPSRLEYRRRDGGHSVRQVRRYGDIQTDRSRDDCRQDRSGDRGRSPQATVS